MEEAPSMICQKGPVLDKSYFHKGIHDIYVFVFSSMPNPAQLKLVHLKANLSTRPTFT